MPQLVRQHGLHLRVPEPMQQGVEEYDPLAMADSREVGVAVAGASGGVDDENTLRREAAAREQGLDPAPELLILERRELVEQRRDEGRPAPGHQEHYAEPQKPRPHPPPS